MAANAFNSSVFNEGTLNNPGLKDQIRGKIHDIADILKDYFEDHNNFEGHNNEEYNSFYATVIGHLNRIRDHVFDGEQLPPDWQDEEFPQELYTAINKLRELVETFDNQALYNNIRNRGQIDAAKTYLKHFFNDIVSTEALHNNSWNNTASEGGRRRTHHRKHKTHKARRVHKKRHTRRHKRKRTLRRKN
jgi:hypothetical protein